MEHFKVVCINSASKPREIPGHLWIEKNEVYTVIGVRPMSIQRGKVGFILKELPLGEDCFPYEYFLADRFRPVTEEDAEAAEFAKAALEECEMDEVDY